MTRPDERRKHTRFEVNLRVDVTAGRQEGTGRIVDLSKGGLCFKLDTPLYVEGVAEVRIDLGKNDIATAVGRVQWSGGRGVGLLFTHIDLSLRRFLDQLESFRPTLRAGLLNSIEGASIDFEHS